MRGWVPFAFVFAATAAPALDIAPATAVRFNTVCAACHEGECSGRLSFDSGAAAVGNHLRRYLGEMTERELREFFALLRFTKEECRILPLAPNAIDGRWDRRALAFWREPATGAWFIPLGRLPRRPHALRLTPAEDFRGTWRILTERFDVVAEGREPSAEFDAAGGPHYLHLQGQEALDGLELSVRN